MVLQVLLVILVCLVASIVTLTIAGASLAAFEKLLKRADEMNKEMEG